MQQPTIQPGRPFPLGVTLGPDGANVAVFSAHAERIELCLLDGAARARRRACDLPERTDGVFHGFVPGLAPGQVYGLRAHRPLGARARPPLQLRTGCCSTPTPRR